MKRKFIAVIFLYFMSAYAFGQSNHEYIKSEMNKINSVYDSAKFLAFDVNIHLTSDTVLGYYDNETDVMNYVLNGRNFFYRTRAAEFMQDDSFAITTFNEEHTMYVTRSQSKSKSSLPLKGFTDSALQYYFQYYQVQIEDVQGGEKKIIFTTDSAWAQYKKIVIQYRPENYLMSSVEFSFKDVATPKYDQSDSSGYDVPENLPILSKKLQMRLKNYTFVSNADMLKYGRYVYFDHARQEYIARGNYRGYKVITSNISDNNGKDVEVPYQLVNPN